MSNLKTLNKWLKYDYENNKIPEYVFQLNSIGLENTNRTLEKMIENKGQCDTTSKSVKFKYNVDY